MATFQVILKFTGLCAFVKHPSVSRMRVMLVNALDSSHVPHEALLLVDQKNLQQPSVRKPNFKFIDDFDRMATLHAFRLRGVDMSFSASPSGFDFSPARTEKECPVNDALSFDWIAKMATVGAGAMRKEVFEAPDEALVLSRMLLTAGHFNTRNFRAVRIGSDLFRVRWQFKNPSGATIGDPQAIAEEIGVEFTVTDDTGSWGLDFAKFGGGTPDRLLLDPSQDVVRLWVVNMPLLNM